MPSGLGLLEGGRVETSAGGGAGAGAACGAAAPLAGGVCDHAALDANSETAPATINPAAIRILFSLNNLASGPSFCRSSGRFPPHHTQYSSWSGLANAMAATVRGGVVADPGD